jgi:hypothetical protein
MEIQVNVQDWLKLSHDTRQKLVSIFHIPRSKGAQIETMGTESIVQSDGHTHDDLKAITVPKMMEYLGITGAAEGEFVTLFNSIVAKIEEDKELETNEPQIDTKQLMLEEWVAILNRLKGQSVEHQMERELEVAIIQLFNIKKEQNAGFSAPKKGRPKKVK